VQVPDDVGGRRRNPPTGTTPENEPPDPNWLYESEPAPESDRTQRSRAETWRVKPSREDHPAEDLVREEKPHAPELPEQRDDEDEDPRDAPEARERRRRRRLLIAAIGGALLLIAAIGFGLYWFIELRWLESTDDAYTQADNTIIAPKVSGYISQLFVTDNQVVKAGQLLLRIDPRDYQAAVNQAQADVASAEANIRNIDAQITAQQAVVDQARADIAAAQANLTFSQQEYARYAELVRTGAGTVQRAQQAAADLREKTAALQHNQATLDQAVKQIGVLKTQRGVAEATLQHNRAALDQAKLNLSYTAITSPTEGAVGDRSARIGQYVQPSTQLMTIVPLGNRIYVVANFKETQIRRMFRGEAADITIDSFPGVHLKATVDSLAPGSGAQFALLPPENATGNFTKIVQRVPVKILFASDHPVMAQMRPGLSVIATVDTRTKPPDGAETLVPPNARPVGSGSSGQP
jgi:membrane fusion protein (multidrug efflux system)